MTGAAHYVGFSVTRLGYTVSTYDAESAELSRYDAGNDPGESSGVISLDSPRPRVPIGTLRRWAKQTAAEIATAAGVPLAMIRDETAEMEFAR